MRKFIFFILLSIFSAQHLDACIEISNYPPFYALFAQELMGDSQYNLFLNTDANEYYDFYKSDIDTTVIKNENIEEWQNFLGLTYDQTVYLVLKSSKPELLKLIAGQNSSDPQLIFVDAEFVKKHKQALRYLIYAKYLEPYMIDSSDGWSYYANTVSKLPNYAQAITVLQRSWTAEKSQELKIRYGYQLVRLAQYAKKYDDAISYFKTYVASLNYKPAMYYYALDHKAGSEKALMNIDDANYDFLQVFVHTTNLKQSTYASLHLRNERDYQALMARTTTDDERNNLYLLSGYSDFNNPLSSLDKILAATPNAIQAKVLMARAVHIVDRDYLIDGVNNYSSDEYYNSPVLYAKLKDRRYPIMEHVDSIGFLAQTMDISFKMANDSRVKDKNFWNLTSAYLCFIKKDYVTAQTYLDKVTPPNELYRKQKKSLEMYIYLCEQPRITSGVENVLYTKYKDVFELNNYDDRDLSQKSFMTDVLANRYFIQGDYAKSFLMNNTLSALEYNPQISLLDALEKFDLKSDKTKFEQFLDDRMIGDKTNDVESFIYNMRGTLFLDQNNFKAALKCFDKVNPEFAEFTNHEYGSPQFTPLPKGVYNGFSNISSFIFGYNKIESFQSDSATTMNLDYGKDFDFIRPLMNKKELTEALIQLQKMANKKDETAAEANYLIGNFYYNTTSTGYYHHILRFDRNNDAGPKYNLRQNKSPRDIYNNIYFKGYPDTGYFHSCFENNVSRPQTYLEKAYGLATDPELKAHIVFALSKCEQENFYSKLADAKDPTSVYANYPNTQGSVLIKDQKYFNEMTKYKDTRFYNEVETQCLYFNYYVNGFGNDDGDDSE